MAAVSAPRARRLVPVASCRSPRAPTDQASCPKPCPPLVPTGTARFSPASSCPSPRGRPPASSTLTSVASWSPASCVVSRPPLVASCRSPRAGRVALSRRAGKVARLTPAGSAPAGSCSASSCRRAGVVVLRGGRRLVGPARCWCVGVCGGVAQQWSGAIVRPRIARREMMTRPSTSRRKLGAWVVVPTAAGVVLLSSCSGAASAPRSLGQLGSTSSTSTAASVAPPATTTTPIAGGGASAPVGAGFLATDGSTYADFIQWSDTNGYISGTIQGDTTAGTSPSEQLSTTTLSISGQVSGGQVSLSFDSSTGCSEIA